jgi:hypothetical protein
MTDRLRVGATPVVAGAVVRPLGRRAQHGVEGAGSVAVPVVGGVLVEECGGGGGVSAGKR